MKCSPHTHIHPEWHSCLTASRGGGIHRCRFHPRGNDWFLAWPVHMINFTPEVDYSVFWILKSQKTLHLFLKKRITHHLNGTVQGFFDTHLAAEHFTVLHIAPHLSFESKRLDCTLLLDLVCRWHKIASVLSALWLWFANEPLKGNKKCLLIILMDRCSSKAKNKRQRGDIIFH